MRKGIRTPDFLLDVALPKEFRVGAVVMMAGAKAELTSADDIYVYKREAGIRNHTFWHGRWLLNLLLLSPFGR
jgi:hypothetical protein